MRARFSALESADTIDSVESEADLFTGRVSTVAELEYTALTTETALSPANEDLIEGSSPETSDTLAGGLYEVEGELEGFGSTITTLNDYTYGEPVVVATRDTESETVYGTGDTVLAGGTLSILSDIAYTGTVGATDSPDDENILGTFGNDTIDGGAGNDMIDGSGGNDYLYGGAGNDLIHGGFLGDDVIDGGDGNDKLYGGYGNDVIDGGDGNDIIYGGPGSDIMGGGAGRDLFVFSEHPNGYYGDWGPDRDTITDFNGNPFSGDVIDLQQLFDLYTDFTGTTADQAYRQGYLYFVERGNPGEAGFGTTVYIDPNGKAPDGPYPYPYDIAVVHLEGVSRSDISTYDGSFYGNYNNFLV